MTNYIRSFYVFIFTFFCLQASAQKIAVLEVTLNYETAGLDIPVSTYLDKITLLPDNKLILKEITGGKPVTVAYQIEKINGQRQLYWIIKTAGNKAQRRIFELSRATALKKSGHIKTITSDSALTISANNKTLLRYNIYNHKLTFPQIKDTLLRSGFIHPLNTPHGQALTRIEAWDHKHHMGLWSAWTHVLFEGDTLDFWNLYKKQGTIRFAKTESAKAGPVFAEYKTLQEHVAYKKNGSEKVAMNETQSMRIYQPDANQGYYLLDITTHLNAATKSPFTILKYSYSSLGWRATEKWNRTNSEVLTSEGKVRKEADGARARWVLVQGKIDDDYGGAVMMSYPANFNHPEPLRVWPENIFNNGDMYTNFVPNKDRDWPIVKGNDYVLKYRFVVFSGKFDQVKSEAAWQYFAHPPVVDVKMNKAARK
ncbi:DUF6807 domain-containing protein [Mucilaginibacter hurinus]|nr:PmoA family protein [Mucilaginibacter hurinus]